MSFMAAAPPRHAFGPACVAPLQTWYRGPVYLLYSSRVVLCAATQVLPAAFKMSQGKLALATMPPMPVAPPKPVVMPPVPPVLPPAPGPFPPVPVVAPPAPVVEPPAPVVEPPAPVVEPPEPVSGVPPV